MAVKKLKSVKKRKRYGSSYWIDPKTKLGYSRVIIPQPGGKNKQIVRRADNATHAQQIADELRAEYAERGESYLTGRNMTFDNLADWYEKEFLVAPRYVNGQKVAGLRTFENEKNKLNRLRATFGKMFVSEIDYDILHRYKLKRLDTGVSIATVNRDFELLRTMFRKSVRRKWLKESPFDFGERLIEKSLESRRKLTLTNRCSDKVC
ncbi:MAG TPA: phage integrase SAM-like domain-containing protein [Pyrinomonadaceae bacterium]|nr:phage integrase SAM-like domain-containing protein [Pyrinomonadaceae bacterium]